MCAAVVTVSCTGFDASVVFDTSAIELNGGYVLVSGRPPGASCATVFDNHTRSAPWYERREGGSDVFRIADGLPVEVAVWRAEDAVRFRGDRWNGLLEAHATLLGTASLAAGEVGADGCTPVRLEPPEDVVNAEASFEYAGDQSCGPRIEDPLSGDAGTPGGQCWCAPGVRPDLTERAVAGTGVTMAWIEPLGMPARCRQ